MKSQNTSERILKRIGSCEKPVVVLYGPAACGKTAAALRVYNQFNDSPGSSECILLAPNPRVVEYLQKLLLEEAPARQGAGAILTNPQVMTFAGVGERILLHSGQRPESLSPFARRLLLGRITDGLLDEDKLPHLAPIGDTPGLMDALDRSIAELKRAAIEPQAFAEACGKQGRRTDGGIKGKLLDLSAIYARYQDHLHHSNTYDPQGRMWQARAILARLNDEAPPPGLEGVRAVVADGFTDFTPTQLEILRLLSGRLERIVITLPLARDQRDRMWRWTRRTLENIRRVFAGDVMEISIEHESKQRLRRAPLSSAWDNLFAHNGARCAPPKNMKIISAPDVDVEVAATAKRVKALLLEGAPAGSIAVIVRSMEVYREPIRRIFAESKIPARLDGGSLGDSPVIRFLLDVASLCPHFEFNHVLRVIKSSYFRPRALGEYSEQTVRHAEGLIRTANVIGGREAYKKAAERMMKLSRRGDQESPDEDEPQVRQMPSEDIRSGAEMLEVLFELVESANCNGGTDVLKIVDKLDVRRTVCQHRRDEATAHDLRSLEKLANLLPGQDDLPDAEHLRRALHATASPAPAGGACVDVMEVLHARSMRYGHVFILGLGEGRFPVKFMEGSLLSEDQKDRLAGAGLALDRRDDLTAREMLLFYLGVSRAEESLTLSFSRGASASGAGGGGQASCFLLSLCEPFGGLEAVETLNIPPGRFLPQCKQIASSRDAVVVAVAGPFEERPGQYLPALAWVAKTYPRRIQNAAMGLWALHRRWRPGECDEFDGRIKSRAHLDALQRRYGNGAVFSPSQLNIYGQCPWWFFGTYVLGLEPLVEPHRRLEPVARGIFCHNVLYRTMTALRDKCGGKFRLGELDESQIADALDKAVADEAQVVEARQPPYPVLWDIQRRQMHREIGDYLQRQRSDAVGLSAHFELGFDAARPSGGPGEPVLDDASTDSPVEVQIPDFGPVLIRGKIDRVDYIGPEPQRRAIVIDYKTGRLPSAADIRSGRALQLVLYSAAVEKILHVKSMGGAFHRIAPGPRANETCFAVGYKHGNKTLDEDSYAALYRRVLAGVGRFVSGIRTGRFDLLPSGDCPAYCPFAQICNFRQVRADLKDNLTEASGER